MNRVLLVVLLFSGCLCACSKSNDVAAQVQNQAVIDNKIITDYLTSHGLPINNVDTVSFTTGVAAPSGVCYIVDTLGTGNDPTTNSTQITVGYTGKILTTGVTFAQTDNLHQTVNFHPSFVLGQVMRGWQLGIPASKVKLGGVVELYIPSRYAYGPYAQPAIGLPANSVLYFSIKIYNIIN